MLQAENIKSKKYVFVFLRIAVVAGGIVWGILWLRTNQNWSELAETFKQMNLLVFAGAFCIFIVGQIVVAFRWWLLLRTQSVFINFGAVIRLHFLGLFYNNFMPSSVGGDFIRAWYVTLHTDKKYAAALSVFVDRAIGLLSTLVIAVFFYMLFLRGRDNVVPAGAKGGPGQFAAEYKWILLSLFAALVVAFCGFLLVKSGRDILTKVWLHTCVYGSKVIAKLKDAIIIYCCSPMTILAVFGLTVSLQILTITGFWFLGVNLGIDVSIKYYYVFFTLTWVLGAVPVSIGGAVVVEGSLVYLFTHFAGVGEEPAAALALCQRAVWMLASLPGAAIHLFGAHLPRGPKDNKMRLEIPEDFSVDCKKPIN